MEVQVLRPTWKHIILQLEEACVEAHGIKDHKWVERVEELRSPKEHRWKSLSPTVPFHNKILLTFFPIFLAKSIEVYY